MHSVMTRTGAPERKRFRVWLAAAMVLPALAMSTCKNEGGGDAGAGGDGSGGDAGSSGHGGDGQGGAMPDAGPTLGITTRPKNLTCKPPAVIDQPAATLSATGCLDAQDPHKPAAGLVPYTVATPLWSDGAEKQRYLAIPDGTTIRVKECKKTPDACKPVAEGGTPEDDGKLDLPEGSVLVKSFAFGGKFIETRLLVKFSSDTWVGYNYEWRDDQSDADLLPDEVGGKRKPITNATGGAQTWHFPDRAQCLRCHTSAAGVSLGIELRQLNTNFAYPSGVTANQLETLSAIGMFAEPLARPLAAGYPAPSGKSGTVEGRARAYLHANCAICHRPRGNFDSMDMRFDATAAGMNVCNSDAQSQQGDLGVAGAKRLVPGEPGKSLMAIRMRRTDMNRMPEIGTSVVDDAGLAVVETWISSLAACP